MLPSRRPAFPLTIKAWNLIQNFVDYGFDIDLQGRTLGRSEDQYELTLSSALELPVPGDKDRHESQRNRLLPSSGTLQV